MTQRAVSSRISDYTHYVTAYAGKVQPKVANLWQHLQTSVQRLDEELLGADAEDAAAHEPQFRARRLLMRLATACHTRRHRSMQEMVNFLLEEPETYSTQLFCRLYIAALQTAALALEEPVTVGQAPAQPLVTAIVVPAAAAQPAFPIAPTDATRLSFSSQMLDYHRAPVLSSWPWYFYAAAVVRVPAAALADDDVLPFAAATPSNVSRRSA